jgi:hypothetical protein
MKRALLLIASHVLFGAAGFAAGIYLLPILTAPKAPPESELRSAAARAEFKGQFRRDLKGSDFLHWGEGTVAVGRDAVLLMGRVAPGPDYKLYLSPEFVETEEQFFRLRERAVRVGDVKTFENFFVPVPAGIDVTKFTTVIVWCEAFSQFITAARYR